MSRVWLLLLFVVACNRSSSGDAVPSNRGSVDVIAAPAAADGTFEGTISGHHFTIQIADGKLASESRSAYTWNLGDGRLSVQDSGPIAAETPHLVARSPRTIVRESDGLWVVTELVTTAGGRAFTCLHQQTISGDGTPSAKQAAARGVAACRSLRVDP